MDVGTDAQRAAGERALAAWDWSSAREAFSAALRDVETPEALSGYGEALWWSGDTRQGITLRERAYSGFRSRGDDAGAIAEALWLCRVHAATFGNGAVAQGWLARAQRLADAHGLDEWHGWLSLTRASCEADPATAERLARHAHDIGAASADADLELCALATIGAAAAAQDRPATAFDHLDEAMAGALSGEGRHRDTVVFTACTAIVTAVECAEFERTVHWVRATDRFTAEHTCPYVHAQCRVAHGAILVSLGEWTTADRELHRAIELTRDALPVLRACALATLADLRILQGRVEEAERLAAELDEQLDTVTTLARIHLHHGRAASAEAMMRRWLPETEPGSLGQLLCTELLGEAALAQDRTADATAIGQSLCTRGTSNRCDLAVARGSRLVGRALAATRPDRAEEHLNVALVSFARLGIPYEVARTRVALADVQADRREVAAEELIAALEVFDGLGARRDADATIDELQRLGIDARRRRVATDGRLTDREDEVLALLGEGLSNPEIAERLYISRRTAEQHVASILRKLGLRNRAEAAAEWVRRG